MAVVVQEATFASSWLSSSFALWAEDVQFIKSAAQVRIAIWKIFSITIFIMGISFAKI